MKPLRKILAATALLLVAPFVLAQGAPNAPKDISSDLKKEIIKDATDLILNSAYVPGVDFTKWNDYLAAEKTKLDDAKTTDEFAGAFQEALGKFDFSHLALYTPRMTTMRATNSTVGVGIRINPTPEGVLVVGLIEGAPAAAAGIEVGDVVTEADGKKVTGPAEISGEEGTKVQLKVKKQDGSSKLYTIIRRKFSTARPEELIQVDKDTAVLKIPSFDTSYNADRVEELVKKAGAYKRLIVDLRGNGGGRVTYLRHFLGTLLPDGTAIGTFINKDLVNDYVKEEKGNPTDLKAMAAWATSSKITVRTNKNASFKGEIAVLVDSGSGSASEMAAEALREVMNSPVAGTKSAGAVLVSVIRELKEGFALQIPIFDYITVKGVRLEGTGVTPDTEVKNMPPFLKPGQSDPAWDAAESLLKKQESTSGKVGTR